ncbi:Glu/Leu/Phe/Val dehydrogenase dimerization domain-containing protein [Paenibacillus xylaniclasticus]|uniref:Glu/Leu/Phe/Val dehydrogenase dimerization domain-containing protein n=1 Tax=Paenibacillus xylaniclasticus TaxID=588083 RepID=UPI000FD77E2F|nr:MULTISPECIES: Glu/Leu/Phe/Val dehydrogenase dimerization domain-containing protein [Paenibacillus]GFN32837.1 leucine dehydrogenase [Paenibacillus curdlanolyticus]
MTLWAELDRDGFEQFVWCRERESDLLAFIAIHSTARGPALGGCRLWPYANPEDAARDAMKLARSMTYKAAAAGLPYGGGKAVVIGRPGDASNDRRFEALGRFIERLNGSYLTGVDVGTTPREMDAVLRSTGYVTDTTGSMGGSGDWTADMTAYGVMAGLKATARLVSGTSRLHGRSVAVQGLGKVGWALCRYLHREGVRLIVTDLNIQLVERAVTAFQAMPVAASRIYEVPCDIFAPCAMGGILNEDSIKLLQCRIVAGSANNQLAAPEHAELLRRRGILYAPDYVINAGGLIATAAELDGDGPFRTRSRVRRIADTLTAAYAEADAAGITTAEAADRLTERMLQVACSQSDG